MQQHTVTTYLYSELPTPQAKQRAREWFIKGNEYDTLSDILQDELSDLLKENNITTDTTTKIYYSLSYCQGDGVQFLGTFTYKENQYTITSSGNYSHSYCTNITTQDEDTTAEDEKQFTELYHTICKQLEKTGYAEIEYQDSEDQVAEILEINEYQFTNTGDRFQY
jgi:hypothetical protein